MSDEYVYRVVDALDAVAKECGKSVAQVALNWLLRRPTVSSLIIGARNEEQPRQNLAAVGWELTKEQIAGLDAASKVNMSYPHWHQEGTESVSDVIGGCGKIAQAQPLSNWRNGRAYCVGLTCPRTSVDALVQFDFVILKYALRNNIEQP